ncbi:MAG: GGDEF domain-containing protein [Methylococcales bacterium]|nr:GGDEF domain-containing protein [Methylococcales bacterium]
MGFFSKQNEDLGEQWRKKYLNLFDEQNKAEHAHHEKEKLLRQFIIQLSIIAEGHDKNLDPILHHVRNHVKSELDSVALKTELKNFNESVKNLPLKKKTIKADVLFEFLMRQYPDSTQQTALHELQKLVNSEETTIEQTSELFIEILNIIEPEVLPSVESDEIIEPIVYVDVYVVSQRLLQYFSALAIPAVFESQTLLLKEALLNPNQATMPFEDVLDDLVQLLLKIKEYGEAEQQDIDQFLLHIANQLSELNGIVSETNAAANDSAKIRNKLDQSVFTQIRELQVEAIKTTSLDTLKENVNQCFKTIASEIKTHHQHEKEQQLKFQDRMAELVNKMISLELETENLKVELKVIHTQATQDALTGLPNRNAYNQRLKDEIARYKRYGTPLTMAIWDIDHFKKINDTFGHKAGDKVLALTANQLQESTRDTDFIARFGGEEFVMLLPNTDSTLASNLVEDLRELIANTGFNANGKAVPITVSFGLTEFTENDTEDSFFERADKALYGAKNQGRNRCCFG